MAEARRAEVGFSLISCFFLKFYAACLLFYNLVLFLQELQKKEVARGAASA